MELVRLECDFPVIGGQQGSLPGLLCVFVESRTVLQCFPCLWRGGKNHRSPSLEEPGPSGGGQHVQPLEQLGSGIL